MMLGIASCVLLLSFGLVQGQDKDSSLLQRQSLQDYSLAKCSDGTPAAYYADRVSLRLIKTGHHFVHFISYLAVPQRK